MQPLSTPSSLFYLNPFPLLNLFAHSISFFFLFCIQAQGKLSLGPQETNAETKDRDYYSQRPHFIPGYTGHIRGKCHLAGRSFGEATHRALVRDYRELACTSPIPSDPSQTRHIPQVTSTHTFVGSQQIGQSLAHVPGYSGYVPRSRESLGVTFGALSRAQLRSANATQDRELLDIEVKDKCRPLFRRQMQKLDSAPLPGGVQTWNAPQKLVPAHLHHVRYLAN